jgi:DNA repair protein RadC
MEQLQFDMESAKVISLPSQNYTAESVQHKNFYGIEKIETERLLSILLGVGHELAHKLATLSDEIVDCTVDQLITLGLREKQAQQLQAALELNRRLHQDPLNKPVIIRSPKDIANYKMEAMRDLKQEHLVCLFLNTKNRVIGEKTIFIGSLNSSIVHPREIFKEAVIRSAASLVCLHNHPSGDPEPSREDIEVTKRLVNAGQLVGIELLDHVIIGNGKFISLRNEGHIS